MSLDKGNFGIPKTVLSCLRCLMNTGVAKWTTFKYRLNFHHQMSLGKSKFWHSKICLKLPQMSN